MLEAWAYPDAKKRVRALFARRGPSPDEEDDPLAGIDKVLNVGRQELQRQEVPIDASIDLALAAL
jgi:hypothetical protein